MAFPAFRPGLALLSPGAAPAGRADSIPSMAGAGLGDITLGQAVPAFTAHLVFPRTTATHYGHRNSFEQRGILVASTAL
ncbi:MAG TPA: hypothetical protein VKJ45_20440 [Blastocatellia bacterium]|nr:hypothetical protein [Blastocatellia bacterium]